MTRTGSEKTAGRTIPAAGALYLIIVLEFFYMATPFAIYFYSVYLPAMEGPDILQDSIHTKAAFEVWLDQEGRVAHIVDPTARPLYGGVPVPVY